MARKDRYGVVVRTDVTDRAILRPALVLVSIVIEWRDDLDDLRVHYIEW